MKIKRTFTKLAFVCVFIFGALSCSSDDEKIFGLDTFGILANQLESEPIEEGGIIAYAYSDANTDHEDVYVLYYVEEGVNSIRFYETASLDVDETDYANYKQAVFLTQRVFDGLFEQILHPNTQEKWIIITYTFNNVTRISKPIKIQNQQQPSVWTTDGITIDQSVSGSPLFTWDDNTGSTEEIYLQIVSQEGAVLSATHTRENQFQFNDTSNVFLNLTSDNAEDIVLGENYNINLLEIDQNNWINRISVVGFEAE